MHWFMNRSSGIKSIQGYSQIRLVPSKTPLSRRFVEQAEKIVAAVEGLYDEPIGRG